MVLKLWKWIKTGRAYGGDQGNHKQPQILIGEASQRNKEATVKKNQEENWKKWCSWKHQKTESRKTEPGTFGDAQLCP